MSKIPTVSKVRALLRNARAERSPKLAISYLVAAKRDADRIRFSADSSEDDLYEAFALSELLADEFMEWGRLAGLKKKYLNGRIDLLLDL